MIDLSNIKTILQVAGISQLKIQFDDSQRLVNAEYVFKAKRLAKKISYEEIIKLLSIGPPGSAISAEPAQAGELKDLPGEN